MVNRSKTSEVVGNLSSAFRLAASYYVSERNLPGMTSDTTGHCSVDDAGPAPNAPTPEKQVFVADASFRELGFVLADYTYYSYGLWSAGGGASKCGFAPGSDVYTFYAHGDLDGNGVLSTFEMAAGSDASNVLYHGRGFYIDKSME